MEGGRVAGGRSGPGGCDPRIEAIVKLISRGSDWLGVGWM